MTTSRVNYPFNLDNAFFVSLDFQRIPEVPPSLSLGVLVEIKVVIDNYPDHLQVNLRVSSREEKPLKFSMELVALFKYTGTNPDQDKQKIKDFLIDRGLIMVWPYLNQMIKLITSQMGMQVFNLNLPEEFNLDLDLLKSTNPQE